MKRPTVRIVRLLLVLSLLLAVFDVPLLGVSSARRRLHLIDRSGSVLVPGGLLPGDADALRAFDQAAAPPGDEISWASFGRNVSFGSTTVDPSGTDLASALEAALARSPTEIVLHSDGRADPGRALFLCRARGVPVHVLPLGPPSPRDVRLVRIIAPARLAPGERGTVEITVESTFATPARVRAGEAARDVTLVPGAPLAVPFPLDGPGEFEVRIEAGDDFDRNNAVRCRVEARSDKRRVLVLSPSGFPPLDEFEAKVSAAFEPLEPYDAVVLAGLPLGSAEQKALAAYAEGFGGGVLLLGGPASFERGGWRGTPIEAISPLRASPDRQIAVVFGIDASGSMAKVWDTVLDAVRNARAGAFGEGDKEFYMTFSTDVRFQDFEALRKAQPGGPTYIARGIREARLKLRGVEDAGRKHLFLFTDGHSHQDEKPEEQAAEATELLRIAGLTVITTDRKIAVPDALQQKIADWEALEARLSELVRGIRDNWKELPGTLDLAQHPATRGVGPVELPAMNLAAAKPGSQVVATVERAPAVAFRQAGGVTGAFAFPYDPRIRRLLVQSIEYVAGDAAEGFSITVEPPVVRVRGPREPPPVRAGTLEVPLRQVRSDLWEGTLPALGAGTVTVRCGRARAAATIPSDPEHAAIGTDVEALRRIARETGGLLLRSKDDLPALPRPQQPEPRPGRPVFLIAALALLFLDLGLSTFWKER